MALSHIMTVDVERWYDGIPSLCRRGSLSSDLTGNLERVLALFAEHDVQATFFWLGELAEEHPELVRRVFDAGHEIGCHGWNHKPLDSLGPARFREDARRAIGALSSITGEPVVSFRAPFFSVNGKTMWALDILRELGVTMDSSILPARSRRSCFPGFEPGASVIETPSGPISEVPVSTCPVPFGRAGIGGAWFRIMPFSFVRNCFERHEREGRPVVFYFHPWEICPKPELRLFAPCSFFCHYFRRGATLRLLRRVMENRRFTSMKTAAAEGTTNERKGNG